MDIWESAKILLRRWYIVGPILLAFAAAAMLVGGRIDPEYRATASMVIVPVNSEDAPLFSGPDSEVGNPLDYLGGQVTLTGIQLILVAEDARGELGAAGFSPSYSVEVDARDPLMLVEVVDRDPLVAQSTADELVVRVQEELDTLQAAVNAPTTQLLEIQVLSQTQFPAEDYGARMRIRILLAVLGILLASAAGLLYDAWATGRDERRRREVDAGTNADDLDTIAGPVNGVAVADELDTQPTALQGATRSDEYGEPDADAWSKVSS